MFEKFFGKKEDAKVEEKERYNMRNEISKLVFNIEQVVKQDLGLSSIKLGEVQSEEFIAKATEIAEDNALWDSFPGNFKSNLTLHGATHEILNGGKDEYRKELRDLIAKHGN